LDICIESELFEWKAHKRERFVWDLFIGEESKVDTILAIRKEKILSWKASSKLKVDVFHLECDALF